MEHQKIKDTNAYPGAPAGWDVEREGGPCGRLPVRYELHPDGTPKHCESAWKPTARELEALNRGAAVILRVIGWQVPVALYVEENRIVEG